MMDRDRPPDNAGVEELRSAVTALALGEATPRTEATAAVRLLVLIAEAEESLAAEEPERQLALRFQQRLRRVLLRTDRRLTEALDSATRMEQLAAFRSTSIIGEALDEGASREKLDVATAEAWNAFVADSNARADDLSEAITSTLGEASAELERLEAGPLADSHRDHAAALPTERFEAPRGVNPVSADTARMLLDAARRAASLIRHAKPFLKGKYQHAGPIIDIAREVAELGVDQHVSRATAKAKDAVRCEYSARSEAIIDGWQEQLDEVRTETTRTALSRTTKVEEALFAQLTEVRDQMQLIAEARTTLDSFVTDAIASGHAEAS
jgi:hypothetical protein